MDVVRQWQRIPKSTSEGLGRSKRDRIGTHRTLFISPKWCCGTIQPNTYGTHPSNANCEESTIIFMGCCSSSRKLLMEPGSDTCIKGENTLRSLVWEETRCITPSGIWM